MKNIFIIGAGSQDGKIIYKKLNKNFNVIKFYRNSVTIQNKRRKINITKKIVFNVFLKRYKPKQIYYFIAYQKNSPNRIKNKYEGLDKYLEINFHVLNNLLEASRLYSPKSKIFYASSSFIYNGYLKKTVNENTPAFPTCSYGISKYLGMELCKYYRKNYKLYIVIGILFNHDSELRSEQFFFPTLINKIINSNKKVLNIKSGFRDWSYAEDIVDAIILTMKQKISSEYIINSGKLISTISVAKRACKILNKNIKIKTISSQKDCLKIKGNRTKIKRLGFKNNFNVDDIILNLSANYYE